MTILILAVIILGWIVFEQFSAKKNQDEHKQKFVDVENKRNEEFKNNTQFLNNVLKVNSVFKKLTATNIANIEIDYFLELEDLVYQTEKEIHLKYFEISFKVKLIGSEGRCVCYTYAKHSNTNIQQFEFEYSDKDDKIIERILCNMKRTIEYNNL